MSFKPLNKEISELQNFYFKPIQDLELLFSEPTNIYIDYANVIGWQNKLKWKICNKRFFNFFKSFTNVKDIKIYTGVLVGDKYSEYQPQELAKIGYKVTSKPVKTIRKYISVSTIPKDSSSILKNFIRPALLMHFDLKTINYLNSKLEELNTKGMSFIEDRKCNFDVEMATDMLLDCHMTSTKGFIVVSGDSDFADSISRLSNTGKKVSIFSTARKIAPELADLKNVYKFDIQRVRDFICKKSHMTQTGKECLKILS